MRVQLVPAARLLHTLKSGDVFLRENQDPADGKNAWMVIEQGCHAKCIVPCVQLATGKISEESQNKPVIPYVGVLHITPVGSAI